MFRRILFTLYCVIANVEAWNCSYAAGSTAFGDDSSIISADVVTAGTTVNISGPQGTECTASVLIPVEVCRLVFNVSTTSTSAAYTEVWLPNANASSWNGRLVATGGSGLSGCVDFTTMSWLVESGYAVSGDNGGHNGETGSAFFDNTVAVVDFSYRARHAAAVLAKQVVQTFYSQAAIKTYYFGCSTGGRQGFKSAQVDPEDFDGIVAGSPALDFNNLGSWSGHFLTLTGANASDPRFLTYAQWEAVHADVLRQCDLIDGVADGVIEDSTICPYNPEYLACSGSPGTVQTTTTTCLTETQIQTVRAVFSPMLGLNNTYLYPRLSPSAELAAAVTSVFGYLQGTIDNVGYLWYVNAIYNNYSWDPTTLNALDMAYANSLDHEHGDISSWQGDLSAYQARGGKIISFHGLSDPIITGENSLRYYQHVARTMGVPPTVLDNFYRFFPIGGMGHCTGGTGAWAFGQNEEALSTGPDLMSILQDWVENDVAPDRLLGTKWNNDTIGGEVEYQRYHCRYPYRTTYLGGNPNVTTSWGCKWIEDWEACTGPSNFLPKLC